MKEVPNIISSKDLTYIKDMLKWNLIISKKARMYKNMVKDEKVKKYLSNVSKTHSEHYKLLLGILE